MKFINTKLRTRFILILLTIIAICLIGIGIKSMKKQIVYASYSHFEETNLEIYDLKSSEEGIERSNTRKEYEKQEIELEYLTKYEEDETLPKGMIHIKQEGRTGTREIVIEKTYEDEELKEEIVISDKVIKASIDKVVVTGSGKYKSNYKIKVGDKLYVTPHILALRLEKDINSEKMYTLSENDEVELLEIDKEWYKISYREYIRICTSKLFNLFKTKYER